MARTVSKHLASSIRAWILIIAGPPWGGVDVVTIPRTGPAYRRNHTSGTSTPESRMSHSGFLTAAQGGAFYELQTNSVSTGTGNWSPFLRVQAAGSNTSEQGYNTNAAGVLDYVGGGFTRTVQLSELPTSLGVDGHVYRVFGLDINQAGGAPNLSL